MSDLQLSLHNIETGLLELAHEIQLAEESNDPEILKLVQGSLQRYVEAEIRKADSIGDFISHLDRLHAEMKDERNRLKIRMDKVEKTINRIMDTCKFVMQGMQWKPGKPRRIEGTRHTISLRTNGGSQAVTITDESLIPLQLLSVTATMPGTVWHDIACLTPVAIKSQIKAELKPSLSAIAKALNQPCPFCSGSGETESFTYCTECSGTGKASVPGARLEERGESVIID